MNTCEMLIEYDGCNSIDEIELLNTSTGKSVPFRLVKYLNTRGFIRHAIINFPFTGNLSDYTFQNVIRIYYVKFNNHLPTNVYWYDEFNIRLVLNRLYGIMKKSPFHIDPTILKDEGFRKSILSMQCNYHPWNYLEETMTVDEYQNSKNNSVDKAYLIYPNKNARHGLTMYGNRVYVSDYHKPTLELTEIVSLIRRIPTLIEDINKPCTGADFAVFQLSDNVIVDFYIVGSTNAYNYLYYESQDYSSIIKQMVHDKQYDRLDPFVIDTINTFVDDEN